MEHRIHIGGLSKQVEDKNDLIDKFKTFGKVKDCEIVKDHSTGLYKGFAFLTLICDDKSWQRCQSILNGSKWKGSQLKLALAKESFLKKLEKERLEIEVDDKSVRRRLGSHEAKDMTLIKDDIPEKKGWKKVRYGRAVCELKIRKNDGTLITIDPEKHQHQLKSFKKKEDAIAPIIDSVPLESLSWFVDDEKIYEDDSTKINLDKEQKSKLKQKESINKKMELLKKQKEGITAALSNIDRPINNSNKIIFSDEGDIVETPNKTIEIDNKVNDLFGESEEEAEEVEDTNDDTKDGQQFLFSDEDEDEDVDTEINDIRINPVFEGKEGHKRLQLQKRFGNDARFKLGEDFINSDEESAEETQETENKDDVKVSLEEEKGKALDLLKNILNLPSQNTVQDQYTETKRGNPGLEWKGMIRYDPDASDAEELEIDPSKLGASNQIRKSDKEIKLGLNEQNKDNNIVVSLTPEVTKDKHFEVSERIGSIFNKDAEKRDQGTFSLFGLKPDSSEESDDEVPAEIEPLEQVSIMQHEKTNIVDDKPGHEPWFFFHLNTELEYKARFGGEKIFQRTEGLEELEKELAKNRKQYIGLYKSRHKLAISKKRFKVSHNKN